MKRITLFLASFVCAITAVFAQSSDLKVSAMSDNLNGFSVEYATIVGREGDKTYVVTHNTTVNLLMHLKRDCAVLILDDNMNIVGQCEIPDSKDDDIRATHMFNGKIYILMSSVSKKTVSFKRYVVDVKKMQFEGTPTVVKSYKMERKDEDYSWVSQSPDKSATALVAIFVNEKKEKLDATEILLDEEMNVEWQKDYPLHAVTDMIVTDDGDIVTIGNTKFEKGKAGRLYLSVINADNAQDYHKDVDAVVDVSRIVSFKNGVALGMGLGTSVKNKKEIKYFGYALNTKDGTGNVSVKTLSSYEKDVFDNSDYGDKSDDPNLDNLVMRNCIATEDGGVGSFQMRWVVVRCNQQGACDYTFFTQGALVFGVNSDGDVVWHHPIRSSSKSKADVLLSYAVSYDKSNVYVLQSEASKTTTDMSKEVKEFKPNKGSKNLAVYTIGKDGNISKKIEELPVEACLTGDVDIVDGYFTGYVCSYKKAALLKLKVK